MNESAPTQAYILPLFAIMTAEQQAKVFQEPPSGHRLIVVATNVHSLPYHDTMILASDRWRRRVSPSLVSSTWWIVVDRKKGFSVPLGSASEITKDLIHPSTFLQV